MQLFLSPLARLASLLLLACALIGCNQQATTDDTSSLSVSGSAEVQAVPDRFVINAAIMQEGMDVKALSQSVNSQMDQALALLDTLGIDRQQVQALSLQISPRWQYQPKRELVGYQVRRDLSITLKSLDHYGELLQGLVAIGINDIGQTQATVSNSHELMLEALANAVKDARAKADKVAAAAGLTVDKALSISVQSSGRPHPVMLRSMAMKAEAPRFEAGTSTLQQQVNVTFSLK